MVHVKQYICQAINGRLVSEASFFVLLSFSKMAPIERKATIFLKKDATEIDFHVFYVRLTTLSSKLDKIKQNTWYVS